ncbi:MAG TPA: GNAT family N-acetyltransferase [Candidatus Saccharimonadales bacterium]|nr:GNAT family N-acetyltransferase [Candidatus Saccharimonadales bacterium]
MIDALGPADDEFGPEHYPVPDGGDFAYPDAADDIGGTMPEAGDLLPDEPPYDNTAGDGEVNLSAAEEPVYSDEPDRPVPKRESEQLPEQTSEVRWYEGQEEPIQYDELDPLPVRHASAEEPEATQPVPPVATPQVLGGLSITNVDSHSSEQPDPDQDIPPSADSTEPRQPEPDRPVPKRESEQLPEQTSEVRWYEGQEESAGDVVASPQPSSDRAEEVGGGERDSARADSEVAEADESHPYATEPPSTFEAESAAVSEPAEATSEPTQEAPASKRGYTPYVQPYGPDKRDLITEDALWAGPDQTWGTLEISDPLSPVELARIDGPSTDVASSVGLPALSLEEAQGGGVEDDENLIAAYAGGEVLVYETDSGTMAEIYLSDRVVTVYMVRNPSSGVSRFTEIIIRGEEWERIETLHLRPDPASIGGPSNQSYIVTVGSSGRELDDRPQGPQLALSLAEDLRGDRRVSEDYGYANTSGLGATGNLARAIRAMVLDYTEASIAQFLRDEPVLALFSGVPFPAPAQSSLARRLAARIRGWGLRIHRESLQESDVAYPITLGRGYVKTELLSESQADELAPAMFGLVVAAYSNQFEGAGRPLPEGIFAAKYNNPDAIEQLRHDMIPRNFQRDGSYYGIRDPENPNRLISMLKILPGEHVEERFSGMVGIAEILTDPEHQGRSYAASLLHTYLKYHADQNVRVMLESFAGNEVNEWYRRLGFVDEHASEDFQLDSEHALPMRYMVTPEGFTVADMVRILESRYPALANAVRKRS